MKLPFINHGKQNKIESIPAEALEFPKFCHRKVFDNYELSQLAESIRLNGIIQPLKVIKEGEGYQIVSGVRRAKAAQIAGLSSLPCQIVFEKKQLLDGVIDSLYHRPLTVFEVAEYISILLDGGELTAGEVAEALNLTGKGLQDLLSTLNFTADERKIILKEAITTRQMKALLRLRDEILRFKTLEEVVEGGFSPIETERYVEKILNPPEEERVEIRQNTAAFLDKRVLDNTFKKVVDTAEKSGITMQLTENQAENFYEYTFRVAKRKSERAEII